MAKVKVIKGGAFKVERNSQAEKQISAQEILTTWLQDNGYEGLCSDCCGCGIDNLIPCGSDPTNCVAAIKTTVQEGDEDQYDGLDVGDVVYIPATHL